MIETVFMFLALQNGSMSVTQVPDEKTCHALLREAMVGVPLAPQYRHMSPVYLGGRCVTVRNGVASPLNAEQQPLSPPKQPATK